MSNSVVEHSKREKSEMVKKDTLHANFTKLSSDELVTFYKKLNAHNTSSNKAAEDFQLNSES